MPPDTFISLEKNKYAFSFPKSKKNGCFRKMGHTFGPSYDFPYHLACRRITVPILRSRKINIFFSFISILLLLQLVTCGFKRSKY